MLNDDIFELYSKLENEKRIQKQLEKIRNKKKDLANEMTDVKSRIIQGMNDIKHKYVEYKNMKITLVKKPEKKKMDKVTMYERIEKIIDDENIDTTEKRDKILQILKPVESGKINDTLNIKFDKDDDSSSDESD